MKPTNLILFIVAFCFLSACSKEGSDPTNLSDSDAKKILLESWKQSILVLPLGTIEVSHGLSTQRDPSQNRINKEDLNAYRVWSDVGILKIEIKKDLTQEEFTWDNWSKLTQGGVAQEVVFSLTPLGTKLNISKDKKYARFPEAEFSIEKITSSEIKELDFDKYCLVTGLHNAESVPEVREALSRIYSADMNPERKFKALFKYDPIESQWKVFALDIVSRDLPFSTNNVQHALRNRK